MVVSSYIQKQIEFLRCKAKLVQFAEDQGLLLTETEGCVLRNRKSRGGTRFVDGVHMQRSLHYERMASDFMLYDETSGKPVWSGADPRWRRLGEYWESLHPDASWGGRFRDANHFSLSNGGRK